MTFGTIDIFAGFVMLPLTECRSIDLEPGMKKHGIDVLQPDFRFCCGQCAQ